MSLPAAGGPAVFRAAQKDEYFSKQLSGSASEVLRLLGNRRWARYSKYIPSSSYLVYNCLTTLQDLQTLGEEYTGIVQVDDTYIKLPTKILQIIYIILGAFGQNIAAKILKSTRDSIKNNRELLPNVKTSLLMFVSGALWYLPLVHELHQVLFFMGAKHYSLPKRIAGINYVSAVPGRRPRISSLRPLGIPYLIKTVLGAVNSRPTFEDVQFKKAAMAAGSDCARCLELNTSPCVLPCGHIFCHSCARTSLSCALCRASFPPHRAVPLQNYSTVTTPHNVPPGRSK